MLYLLFLLPIFISVLFPKRLPVYLAVVIAMYSFYTFLWIDTLFLGYDVKAGWKGFSMFFFTALTAPLYLIAHLIFIRHAWPERNKKVLKANIAGIVLCVAHIIAALNYI